MGIFKKKAPSVSVDVQIMMLGARRTGKTSMLASMYAQFDSVTRDTGLILSKEGGIEIDKALNRMKQYFIGNHKLNELLLKLDNASTIGFEKMDFTLQIKGKNNVKPHRIRFIDCSGESITNRTNEEEFKEQLEKTDVVMIAIDTVLLMEEQGYYNGQNAIDTVTEYIINAMNPKESVNKKKMILFLPIKCEKYFHQHEDSYSAFYGKRMDEVVNRIEKEYAKLLGFLTSPECKEWFTVAILPVLTLGGLEFDDFLQSKSESEGEILTEKIQYRYCSAKPEDTIPQYAPRYCERPLIYSLRFVQKKIYSDYMKKAYRDAKKKKKKISSSLAEWFKDKQNRPKETDFLQEIEKASSKLNLSEGYPGYKLIQDPDAIEKEIKPNMYQ